MKTIVDRTAQAVFGHTELTAEEGQQVNAHLATMSADWSAGRAPDLSDSARRFGYTYCYAAAHAHLCEVAMRGSQDLRRLVTTKVRSQEPLRVCIFGGGPGTEIVGLAKFLSRRVGVEDALDVDILVLDREAAWQQNINITTAAVSEALATEGFEIKLTTQFQEFDICNQPGNILPQVLGREVYIFNHIISEIFDRSREFEPLIASICEAMPAGAVLLITDREQNAVVDVVLGLMARTGLEVASFRGLRRMDYEEDCNALKDAYFPRINWRPRVKWGLQGMGMDQGAFGVTATKQEIP